MNRRTTLRPIDVGTRESPPPTAPAPPDVGLWRAIPRSAVVGGTLLVGVLLIGGLALTARSSTRASPAPAVAPTAAPAATTSPCPSIASFLDVIASYEGQARYSLAASTAQSALRTPGLCEADGTVLGQKLVALSREALFEQPPAPEDAPDQRRIAIAYADLKATANQYGVALAPLPIAQRAYDDRLFLLATAAYADAFRNGVSSPTDRETVRADYAAQYNLGLAWSRLTDSAQRLEGLARLATACRIDEREQLGSPEACNQLQMLAGAPARWPAPAADPLLDVPPTGSAPGGS
jgi:hypothetical protein